ncbi:hypothetical protein O3J91_06675 [Yersinia pestis]|nr:hypothetical protein [Yersinia pestis]MDL1129172.1 hypothetical protein [Yersinia pestis]
MPDITTTQEHEERLIYLEKLLREQPESSEIEPLVNAIEAYENIHYPLEGFL